MKGFLIFVFGIFFIKVVYGSDTIIYKGADNKRKIGDKIKYYEFNY